MFFPTCIFGIPARKTVLYIHVQFDLHCLTCSYQVLRERIVELEAKVQKKKTQLKEAAETMAKAAADTRMLASRAAENQEAQGAKEDTAEVREAQGAKEDTAEVQDKEKAHKGKKRQEPKASKEGAKKVKTV